MIIDQDTRTLRSCFQGKYVFWGYRLLGQELRLCHHFLGCLGLPREVAPFVGAGRAVASRPGAFGRSLRHRDGLGALLTAHRRLLRD